MGGSPLILTAQKVEEIKKLYQDPAKFSTDIANITGVKHRTVKKALCYLHKKGLPYIPRIGKHKTFVNTELELFSENEYRREREKIYGLFDDGRAKKIIGGGDMHCPFHDEKAVRKSIEEGGDIYVVGADTLDCYSISHFRKDKIIRLQDEIVDGLYLLDLISKKFKYVVVLEGNHEKRLIKILHNRFEDKPDLIKRFEQSAHLLSDMGKVFKNVHVINNFWCKIGQTIFAHPDWYSVVPGKTVLNTYEYMIKDGQEFDCIVNFHTHRLAKMCSWRKLLIEAPALSHRMDYTRDGKKFKGEWAKGFAIINQDKQGRTDYGKTELRFLGWG